MQGKLSFLSSVIFGILSLQTKLLWLWVFGLGYYFNGTIFLPLSVALGYYCTKYFSRFCWKLLELNTNNFTSQKAEITKIRSFKMSVSVSGHETEPLVCRAVQIPWGKCRKWVSPTVTMVTGTSLLTFFLNGVDTVTGAINEGGGCKIYHRKWQGIDGNVFCSINITVLQASSEVQQNDMNDI